MFWLCYMMLATRDNGSKLAKHYIANGTPTLIFTGDKYGTSSSRDWAEKGTQLLKSRGQV